MSLKMKHDACAAAAAMTFAAFANGGPSGAKVDYHLQGHLGEVMMNPYGIAPLTAIVRDGGYTLSNVTGRVLPKLNGQEIKYKVSDSQLLSHGGIPVFGLYPAYRNTVEVEYDRVFFGKTEHIREAYKMMTQPVYGLVPFPKTEVKKAATGKFADRLYYVNNIGGNNNPRHADWNNPAGGELQWSY